MLIVIYLQKIKQTLILIKYIQPKEAYKCVDEAKELFGDIPKDDPLHEKCEALLFDAENAISNSAGATLNDAVNLFNELLYALPDEIKLQIINTRQ